MNKLGDGALAPEDTLVVVSPVNMGNGLVWDSNTGTYNVNVAELAQENQQLNQKVTNLENLLNQVLAKNNQQDSRLSALEMPCELTVDNVQSVTVNDNHNVIVSTGGTITFPNTLKAGKSFTVIRNGDAEVKLEGVFSPKGKKLDQNGSAVTVIVTAQGMNRAFGALKV